MMKKYFVLGIIILFVWNVFPANNPKYKRERRTLSYSALTDTGFNLGQIGVTMNDYGRIQIYDKNGILNIWQFTPLVATSDTSVFNYYINAGISDSTKFIQDSSFAANTALYGAFDNSYTTPRRPPNVLVKTTIYGWSGSNYVLVKFTVINKDSLFMNAMIGAETVAQNNNIYGYDTVQYVDTANFVDIYYRTHVGLELLSGNLETLTSFEYFDGYQKDSLYYVKMNYDGLDRQFLSDSMGSVTITAQTPQGIYPGDSVTVFYGISIGDSLAEVYAGLDTLILRYSGNYTGIKQNNYLAPASYKLLQNYPNPFNPSTKISFSIANQEHVSLKIYNILGEVVSTLVNEVRGPGNYSVRFDAHGLSSGIYFYELNAGNFRSIKKMMILK
jgi:hypothetical protein